MSVEKDKKTGTWSFRKRVTNAEGKQINIRKRGFETKKEALFAEVNYFYIDTTCKIITINELANEYFKFIEEKFKYSTIYGKKIMINKYILPTFGKRFPSQINNADIINWQKMLQKTLSISRINKISGEFKSLYEYGEKFHNLTTNPPRVVGGIKNNNPQKVTMLIWTPEEFNRFISNCDNITYKTLFYLLYYTGMRKGEALALKWEDISEYTRQVSITKTLSQKHDKSLCSTFMVTSPKTASGIRNIDLPSKLFDILMEYKNEMRKQYKEINSTDYVFGINKPLCETPIERYKNKICEISNVKKIRMHDFRHSHASLLINMGINPLFIKERLGHKDVSTTLDVYSHLFPTNQREIVNRLDNVIN